MFLGNNLNSTPISALYAKWKFPRDGLLYPPHQKCAKFSVETKNKSEDFFLVGSEVRIPTIVFFFSFKLSKLFK